jgi:hypothetical protein
MFNRQRSNIPSDELPAERGGLTIARRRDESLDDWCTRVVRECADARKTLKRAQIDLADGRKVIDLTDVEARLEAAEAEVLVAFEAWRLALPRSDDGSGPPS